MPKKKKPPKRKRAAAKKQIAAPPTKTMGGEKDIKGEKTSTVSQDQGATGLPSWLESARPRLLTQWEQSLNKQQSEIVRLLDILQRPEHDSVVHEEELSDKLPKFIVQLQDYRWLWQTEKESSKKRHAEWSQFRESRDNLMEWMYLAYDLLWEKADDGSEDLVQIAKLWTEVQADLQPRYQLWIQCFEALTGKKITWLGNDEFQLDKLSS